MFLCSLKIGATDAVPQEESRTAGEPSDERAKEIRGTQIAWRRQSQGRASAATLAISASGHKRQIDAMMR
jgi:hypothetical protein